MTKYLLEQGNRGTSIYGVAGEAMTEPVRRHASFDACTLGCIPYNVLDPPSTKYSIAFTRTEHRIIGLHSPGLRHKFIVQVCSNWNKACLASLPVDGELRRLHIAPLKLTQFAHAQTSLVKRVQYRTVTRTLPDRCNECLDLLFSQDTFCKRVLWLL